MNHTWSARWQTRCRLRNVLLGLATSISVVCAGQATDPQSPNTSAVSPTFEVATIKPNHSGLDGLRSKVDNYGNFQALNVTAFRLMRMGFDLPEGRIAGGPPWIKTSHFDIQAKPDRVLAERMNQFQNAERGAATRQMMRSLLADRFALTTHRETRELPIYALVLAKNGPKFKATSVNGTSVSSDNGHLTIKSVAAIRALSQFLEDRLGRVVVDKTGVEGGYEFKLNWASDDLSAPKQGSFSNTSEGPSLFTALQEQLGLKLESQKGPVGVLVIDHAELPSDN